MCRSTNPGKRKIGRSWYSPEGENIYCSSRWPFYGDLNKLSGLSLITSLAVLAAIKDACSEELTDIKIKWPNDLLWGEKKLCGTLIEIITISPQQAQVIIGIGLNVNSDTNKHSLVDRPWCSLYDIMQRVSDRNILIASLIIHLDKYIGLFKARGLAAFMDEWKRYDYLGGVLLQ